MNALTHRLTLIAIAVLAAVAIVGQLYLMRAGQLGSAGSGQGADLAYALGISTSMAKKLIKLANSWYLTIALAAFSVGWGAAIVKIAAKLAARYGLAYAAAW